LPGAGGEENEESPFLRSIPRNSDVSSLRVKYILRNTGLK